MREIQTLAKCVCLAAILHGCATSISPGAPADQGDVIGVGTDAVDSGFEDASDDVAIENGVHPDVTSGFVTGVNIPNADAWSDVSADGAAADASANDSTVQDVTTEQPALANVAVIDAASTDAAGDAAAMADASVEDAADENVPTQDGASVDAPPGQASTDDAPSDGAEASDVVASDAGSDTDADAAADAGPTCVATSCTNICIPYFVQCCRFDMTCGCSLLFPPGPCL